MKLSDATIERLIKLITVDEKYHPGDKLPNETTLANELGVSRSTIRTAVRYLVGQGVLEIKIGLGTFVSQNSSICADFGFKQLQHIQMKLRDLYELRLLLEPQLAYYAATRATNEELQSILDIGAKIQQHKLSDYDDSEGNRQFHTAIAHAAHNEFGSQLDDILNDALLKAFNASRFKQQIEDFAMDHQLIMDYLANRDADGAKLAMDLHLKRSMEIYHLTSSADQ